MTLLAASGDIDMTASPEFGRRLESAPQLVRRRGAGPAEGGAPGLDGAALLACRHVAQARGSQLVLVCSRPPVRQVLEVTGLIGLFGVHREREAALEAIGRPTQPKR